MIISIRKMKSVLQCFLLSVLLLGFMNIFSTVAGKSEIYSGKKVVVEGEPFMISCQISIFDILKWQKDSRPIVPDKFNQYNVTEHKRDNIIISNISVPHAQTSHSGSYRCSSFRMESHHLYVLSADSISVNYDAESTRYKTIEDFELPLELQCNTTESGIRMEWFKDNKNITQSEGRIKVEGSKLVIKEPSIEDTGNYTCRSIYTKVNGTIAGERVIEVVVKPQVGILKDVTVVEGEKLKLECVVEGKPVPTITWRFGNDTYDQSKDRVILEDHDGVPNAAFIIKEAQMSDRGEYICLAGIANTTSEAKVYVRVKDKLAALWPFLGICAEVFVLCAIILIYEKKRNKTELEESDTDNSPETKNTPDHGKDAVRQRK